MAINKEDDFQPRGVFHDDASASAGLYEGPAVGFDEDGEYVTPLLEEPYDDGAESRPYEEILADFQRSYVPGLEDFVNQLGIPLSPYPQKGVRAAFDERFYLLFYEKGLRGEVTWEKDEEDGYVSFGVELEKFGKYYLISEEE